MNSLNINFEKVARVSIFLGLVRLLELRARYPDAQDGELINAMAAGAASQMTADVETAAGLIDILQLNQLREDARSMRLFLTRLLECDQPPWIVAALRGRSALFSIMPPAAAQCFSLAKLFDSTPDTDAVLWWDKLAESQRSDENGRLKDRGREGERLTLEYEIRRLSGLGINEKPKWVAIDDEWLGYDVLSYDLKPNGATTNRLIEVKACSGLPLQIFLTRNEWERAIQAKDAYIFHVWYLPTGQLIELDLEHIRSHIPEDQGSGVWREVRIQLKNTKTNGFM
jgi:hypothetical protein